MTLGWQLFSETTIALGLKGIFIESQQTIKMRLRPNAMVVLAKSCTFAFAGQDTLPC